MEFFSSIKSNIIGQSIEEKKEVKKSEAQLEFERKRIWSIAGAVTLFLGYIIMNGIVSIEIGDDNEEYEDGEYYEQEEENFENDIDDE
jgi:hypothetical protein